MAEFDRKMGLVLSIGLKQKCTHSVVLCKLALSGMTEASCLPLPSGLTLKAFEVVTSFSFTKMVKKDMMS